MKIAWNLLLLTLGTILPISLGVLTPGKTLSNPVLAQLSSESATPTPQNSPTEASDPSEPGETTTPTENTPSDTATDEAVTATDPEEIRRFEIFAEADRLYLAGDIAAAEQLYRQVKPPFSTSETGTLTVAESEEMVERPAAIFDPAELSPGGQVYWREAQAGLEQNLESRIFVPLQLLVEREPQFIPAHVQLAEAMRSRDRIEEAFNVLEQATNLYPNEPELLKAKIAVQGELKQWLEASIAARQFALLNPDHPEAATFAQLAEENLKQFQSYTRETLASNAIANVVTGALSIAVTGSPFAGLSAVDTLILLARGESGVGRQVAKAAKEQLEMIEDEAVLSYINELGNKLASVSGRSDFEYEFYVVLDEDLNAFALPGGKVFVNAGAILKTRSEAELAGLLTHEIAHAVLSHGFQAVTQGNLIGSVGQHLPLGGLITNLFVLDYSRDMERQADALGTRMLVAAGYAADGLRNLMVTLKEEDSDRIPRFLSWLSSHPPTDERIQNLEALIERGGYNRYAYEGVEKHAEIQARVKELLRESKENQEADEEEETEQGEEQTEEETEQIEAEETQPIEED